MDEIVNIRLVKVTSNDELDEPELCQRFRVSTKSRKTVSYRALREQCEVAFVAIDRWPEIERLVLYELFVPRHLRKQNVGSAVLRVVEQMAAEEGFAAVRLYPNSLEMPADQTSLERWYQKRGYKPVSDQTSDLEKLVSVP